MSKEIKYKDAVPDSIVNRYRERRKMSDEEKVRRAYTDPSPTTFIEAYAEAVEKKEALKSEDTRTTLGLQGFKQRELHTVMWALREFADAAGIEIHNGIKERYDAERKTYGISLRFYKK